MKIEFSFNVQCIILYVHFLLVDKIIISKDSLKKLCNDIVPLSYKSISEINYTKLNLISFRLIGCYGNHTLIGKLLLNKGIINQQVYVRFVHDEINYSINHHKVLISCSPPFPLDMIFL